MSCDLCTVPQEFVNLERYNCILTELKYTVHREPSTFIFNLTWMNSCNSGQKIIADSKSLCSNFVEHARAIALSRNKRKLAFIILLI